MSGVVMVRDNFEDIVVVYPAEEPGQFVAHSIRTDQIGVAPTPHEALIEVLHALYDLFEEARKDRRVEIQRLAPPEVRERFFESATKVPDEVWNQILRRFAKSNDKGDDYWEPIPDTLFDTEEEDRFVWRDIHDSDLLEPA